MADDGTQRQYDRAATNAGSERSADRDVSVTSDDERSRRHHSPGGEPGSDARPNRSERGRCRAETGERSSLDALPSGEVRSFLDRVRSPGVVGGGLVMLGAIPAVYLLPGPTVAMSAVVGIWAVGGGVAGVLTPASDDNEPHESAVQATFASFFAYALLWVALAFAEGVLEDGPAALEFLMNLIVGALGLVAAVVVALFVLLVTVPAGWIGGKLRGRWVRRHGSASHPGHRHG